MSIFTKLANHLFPRKVGRKAIILGLDAAGKTTLLYRLKLGEVVTTIPSIGFNLETVTIGTGHKHPPLVVDCWDVGGCSQIRPLIRHYIAGISCILFVVDSADRERIAEAIDELGFIIGNPNDQAFIPVTVPVLVLANKQDLKGVMTADEVALRFKSVCIDRPWHVVPTCFIGAEWPPKELMSGFDWLTAVLAESAIPTPSQSAAAPSSIPPKPFDPTSDDALASKLASYVERAESDSSPAVFLDQFEKCSLPSWDHYTHIRLAYLILSIYGRQKGKDMLFDGIKRYIETSSQTTGRTFHLTMTYFWIQMVDFAIRSMPPDEKSAFPEGLLDQGSDHLSTLLVLNPYLANGNLWADYYAKETMMSPQAKEEMVLPDKKPLPNLIARDAVRKTKVDKGR